MQEIENSCHLTHLDDVDFRQDHNTMKQYKSYNRSIVTIISYFLRLASLGGGHAVIQLYHCMYSLQASMAHTVALAFLQETTLCEW